MNSKNIYRLDIYLESNSICELKLSIQLINDNSKKPNIWYTKNKTIIDSTIGKTIYQQAYEAYKDIIATIETIKKHYALVDWCFITYESTKYIKLNELDKKLKKYLLCNYTQDEFQDDIFQDLEALLFKHSQNQWYQDKLKENKNTMTILEHIQTFLDIQKENR